MKKDKTTAAPAVPVTADPVSPGKLTARETACVVLYFVLFLIFQMISTMPFTMACFALSLLVVVRKSSVTRLRERMSLALVGLIALTVMYGVALLVSPYDTEALATFYKYLSTISMAVIPLCRWDKRYVRPCLWGVMGYNVFHALITIEGATSKVLFPPFFKALLALGVDLSSFSMGDFSTRLNGLYNASNVTASLHAISLLIGLYLIATAATKREKFLAYELTGINAVAFLGCASRGAMLCFGVAGIVYLALQKKEVRVEEFFRIVICVVITFACQIICTMPAIANTFVPLAVTLLCGVVMCLVDQSLNRLLTKLFTGHMKLIIAGAVVLVVGVCAFFVVAVNRTGPFSFSAGERMARVVDLAPGTYTVTGDWDGDPMAYVGVKDKVGLYTGSELIYEGPLSELEFTIDEDILRVEIAFVGQGGEELRSVVFSDGTELKLDYPLLPKSIMNRLQGSLLTDSSVLLRLLYMKDALKIFAMSPIYGCGLGSTEGLYTAVQDVYYMSHYVHNHILQYMADMGILGLLAYLALAGGVLLLLIRRYRRQKGDAFAAVMIAVWVMMNTHSLIEFNFSIRCYLSIAILLMVLWIMELAEESDCRKLGGSTLRLCGRACAAVLLAFALFFGSTLGVYIGTQLYAANYETTDYDEFMRNLETFITLDIYDDGYHKTTYIGHAVESSKYIYKADRYAESMTNSRNFTHAAAAAEYFYLPTGNLPAMFDAIEKALWQKAADKKAWNIECDMLRNKATPILGETFMSRYLEGLVGLRDYWLNFNEGRLQPIELSEENEAFLEGALTAYKSNMTAAEVREYLLQYTDPEALEEISAAQ